MRAFRALRFLRWPRRSGRRHVSYVITLTNTSASERATTRLLAPIAHSTGTQVIDDPALFSMPPSSLIREERFGNQCAHWDIVIPPEKKQVVTITYQVLPKKIRTKKDALPHATEYRPNALYDFLREQTGISLAPTHPFMREHAESIKHTCATLPERIEACAQVVKKTLHYGNPVPGLYSATDALTKKTVDCGGYSTLFISLLIACDIPARLVSGFWLNPGTTDGEKAMHAWVEVGMPDGSWLPVDLSVEALREAGRTRRHGGIGIIDDDRLIVSVGSDVRIPVGTTTVDAPLLQAPILVNTSGGIRMDYHLTTSFI